MSSGGWEVVGKNKKDKNNGKAVKMTKAEKKKFIENAPKVEDFLPLTQVKTLYDNLDSNKENKKPVKEKEHKTKENEEKKKQQKYQQHSEKKKQEPKEKLPKSIKDALNAINAEELNNFLSTAIARYLDAPLLWLKDLVAYLNSKIPIDNEDAIFSSKPKDYPLSAVPKTIYSTLEKAIALAGPQAAQPFYEITLTAMASDMAKGVPVIGYKIFLQLLTKIHPEIATANISKLISIRNSYQNRKPIGLSFLWTLSQAGKKNLAIGLKVWHEVMSSMLETKSYSSYVAQILNDLVFGHENVQDLKPELYLDILEVTCSGKLNVPANVGREINTSIERLRFILLKNKNINYTKLFEMLISKANQKVNANYRDEIIKTLAACLTMDVHCFSVWRSLYVKHLYQSNLLLTYINSKWDTLRGTLNVKALKETLIVFQTTNERWKKGRDEQIALACNKGCKALLTKMTASNSRKFPWKKGCFILLILIGAILAYDYQKNGDRVVSHTQKILKNSGINVYAQKAKDTATIYFSNGLEYLKSTSPEYYKATVDFCTPYVKLAGEMYLISKNLSIKIYNNTAKYVARNGPIVKQTIDYYIPGMLEEIQTRSIQTLDLVKVYSTVASGYVFEQSAVMIRWLEKNVFVGKLSPENLQNYAMQAIDTTQTFASQTYDWVYEKVQTLSKVP